MYSDFLVDTNDLQQFSMFLQKRQPSTTNRK